MGEQKKRELNVHALSKKENEDADDKATGVTPKADRENEEKQLKTDIECYGDDSSIVYRTSRCAMKRDIADKKYELAKTKAMKNYKDAKDGSKATEKTGMTKTKDLALKIAEAHLEYLETL